MQKVLQIKTFDNGQTHFITAEKDNPIRNSGEFYLAMSSLRSSFMHRLVQYEDQPIYVYDVTSTGMKQFLESLFKMNNKQVEVTICL